MSLTKVNNATPANRHSNPNQSFIQQTAVQRKNNENAGPSEHESDVQTAVQLKSQREPSADFIRPNALVQAKLNIGKPNDKYEVEADRIADKVVSGANAAEKKSTTPAPKIQKKDQSGPVEGDGVKEEDVTETDIQQKSSKSGDTGEDDTTVQEKPLSDSITPVVQLKELPPIQQMGDGEEKEVQTKLDSSTEKIQTKCSSCGKEASAEKLNIQQKCSKCEAEEKVQKMESESSEEVQTKLDTSTEEVQQMADPQEEKVQTKCAACGKEESAAKLNVQQKCSKCEAEEKKVQQKSNGEGSSAGVESNLKASKGKGAAMDDKTRGTMESGFGSDFSGVRIHTDSNAVNMNKSLGSKAFTNGSDIYFNEGQYSPSSKSGQHLLAHELTHTVQQGAAPKGVQKKENNEETSVQKMESENKEEVQTKLDSSTEDSNVQKMEADEETVQQFSDLTIQKAEDPCKKKEDKDKKKSNEKPPEESQATKDCKAKYIPKEDPGDRDEPDKEEQTKDIEAKPKMGADERQAGAPPVDANIKKEEGPKAENPLEICKKREEKQAQQGKPPGGKEAGDAANAGVGQDATPAQVDNAAAGAGAAGANAAAAGGEKNAGNDPSAKKDGEKKSEGEQKGLTEAAGDGKKKKKTPTPQGEASSPSEVGKRDENLAVEAGAIGGIYGTVGAIKAMGATPVAFMNENEADNAAQDAMANAFIQDKSARAASIIEEGMKEASRVDKETARRRNTIEAEVKKRRTQSKAFFRQKAQQSMMAAMQSKLALSMQHSETVSQINAKAALDISILREQFNVMAQDIRLKYMAQVDAINTDYDTSYKRHLDIGKENGKKAKKAGKDMARKYRRADVDGASSKDKKLVTNKEKDGFWDGYLTYNRYMARADSAEETGKQHQEGMETQGKEAAEKLTCDRKQRIEVATEMAMQGIQNLQCALDDAVETIELRKTATVGQANAARDEFIKNIDAALKGTIQTLKDKEVAQDLLLSDYGARQIVALENMSLQARIGLYKGLQGMADNLKAQLEGFVQSVVTNTAPDAKDYGVQLEQSSVQFESMLQATKGGVNEAVSGATSMVSNAGSKGRSIIRELHFIGIKEGNELFATYSQLMVGIDGKRAEFFAQHLTTAIAGLQMDYDQGLKRMQSVVNMVTKAYEEVLKDIRGKIKASEEGLQKGMTKTLNEDLQFKICSEAEKAAEAVQPWWKSVLKVLLVILVIVIVIALTVVTAGAFAGLAGAIGGLAGTMIAGALAGAIFGALASFLITVGMNVINHAGTGKLTWESAFKGALDAAIQGAIAGAIGGMAGPLVGVLSKGAGVVGKFVIEETVEIAFDMIGGIIGDLVLHGEVKDWGNIAFGALVGRGMARGMEIAPALKNTIKNADAPSTPKPKADAGSPKVDADAGGAPKVDAGSPPKADAGATPKTDTGSTPKSDTGSTPKADGGSTPKKTGDSDASTPTKKGDADANGAKNAEPQPQKKLGDEQQLENTRTKNDLNDQEYEIEVSARDARRPGKAIDQEHGGIKYTEEVELPNGHKWRKRKDGGWCRFSQKKCYSSTKKTKGQEQAKDAKWPENPPKGYEYYHRPGETTPGIRNKSGNNGKPKEWDPVNQEFKNVEVQKVEGVPREGGLPEVGTPKHKEWQDSIADPTKKPCFPEGTLVFTPSGLRAIETIKAGDYVWSYDHTTQSTKMDVVTGLMTNWTYYMMNIQVEGRQVRSTMNHPFWEEEEEKYIRADKLNVGMALLNSNNEKKKIEFIEKQLTQETTYNIEIGGQHNYFVTDQKILVHNDVADAAAESSSKFADPKVYKNSTVYLIHDSTGKVIYVGQTIQDMDARFNQHITDPKSAVYQHLEKELGPGFTERQAKRAIYETTPVDRKVLTSYELTVQEQYYIDKHGGIGDDSPLKNKVNAIVPEKRLAYSDLHNPCI